MRSAVRAAVRDHWLRHRSSKSVVISCSFVIPIVPAQLLIFLRTVLYFECVSSFFLDLLSTQRSRA